MTAETYQKIDLTNATKKLQKLTIVQKRKLR